MIKNAGGILSPANDIEAERLTKFKNNGQYEIEIKLNRNPAFLRKVFAFFNFCYEHWDGERLHEHCSHEEQFDRFRKDLTILAGFYVTTTRLNGEQRIEAESLAFGNMKEERFQQCYNALIKAALKYIFHSCDVSIENKLIEFF